MYGLQLKSFINKPYRHFLPGITSETVQTCSELLEQNHREHHVYFFLQGGFHNHTTHHLLAALGVGANSQTLRRIYEDQKKMQLPLPALHSSDQFDPQKCRGNDTYYHDYLQFFQEELESTKYNGNIEALIEDYLFNKDYLALILAGAYHSFIHLGYAIEFQSKLMAIEGLAMASIDRVGVRDVIDHLDPDPTKNGTKTALEILELAGNDKRFDDKVFYDDPPSKSDSLLKRGAGPLIAEYSQMWKCDINDLRRVGVLVAAGAIRPDKLPFIDFFLMHATTSSLFLELFAEALKSEENKMKLLRAKFADDLLFYISQGRPKLNLNYLYYEYQPSKEHLYANSANPWLPLIEKSLTHTEEHVVKTIRALMYAEKCDPYQENDAIPYLKIAQMTMDAMFPVGKKDWSHGAVGWDEDWTAIKSS